MDEETIGFLAKAPVSDWNKRLGVDYPGVFKALLKASLAAATANAPGAISAAIDGFFAFKLEERQLPPAELAWLLIRRALARAMAELTVEVMQRRGLELKDKDGLVAALDQALEGTEIRIAPEFFERPTDHPVGEAVHAPFRQWMSSLGLNQAEADSAQPRLRSYFAFALHHEWQQHAETYSAVEVELRKLDTPFAKARARERAWLRNLAYLERLTHEPVFQEAFGLSQVYVPLRGWHKKSTRDKAPREGERGFDPQQRESRVVVDLERQLDAWLAQGNKNDPIRVLCGGPGSGKTSLAKIWAAKLARAGHHVLYVPLHRLDLRTEVPDVQAALWEFLSDRGVLPHDPLDSQEGERRLVILFDGLDELAMQGRAGQEVANNFIQAVDNKIGRINERNDRCVQVVFGGRDVVVERMADARLLHVLPYQVSDPESFEDPEGLVASADYACDRWWRQFGQATGEGYEAVPEPLAQDALADITAQPLLNYLVALSYRRGELDFRTAPNINLIYDDLLKRVYRRPWGPVDHPTSRLLSEDEFSQLLDEFGLAAWHGARRTITETQVEEACKRAGLTEQLARFKEGARAGAISLLAAFYFRQAGKIQGERTFEFTHKTFGEYLMARRIVRWVEDISEDRALNRKNRQRGKTEEEALVKWVEGTGPTALDRDLLAFLVREVGLRDRQAVEQWRETLAELFSDQLKHGLPMHRLELPTFQEMTRQARNAEETLLAAVFACADSLFRDKEADEPARWSEIQWPERFSARDLLTRLDQGVDWNQVARSCLGWLNLGGAGLERTSLFSANLVAANLDKASLFETSLFGANLEGASLVATDLAAANLVEANLAEANLGGANLIEADLVDANLARGNLERADLIGANLVRANLDGANLNLANLNLANLQGANLVGVQGLDEAHGLEEVESWRGAKIERSWVEKLGLDAEKLGLQVVDDRDDQ